MYITETGYNRIVNIEINIALAVSSPTLALKATNFPPLFIFITFLESIIQCIACRPTVLVV